MDNKVLLKGAYSVDQRSAVRWIEDHTLSQWSDGASGNRKFESTSLQLRVINELSPGGTAIVPRPHYDAIQAAMRGVFHELGLAA